MSALDQTAQIRPGEELDLGRLSAYLRATLPVPVDTLAVEQFPGGHSNLTYLVRVDGQEYVLRRPPFGNQVKSAHDMGREFRVLSALAPVFPPAPRPVLYCDDPSVLGAPFYLMERRRGIVLRRMLPEDFRLDAATASELSAALLDTLAALHRLDYRAIGLGEFGKPEGYVARQVRGWTERYHAAETEAIPEMDAVAVWLAEHLPPERGAAVIHNDFKFDNLLLDPERPSRVVAVLDWEMATIGDPLMDLGTALAYWVEPNDPAEFRAVALGPTTLPGMWSRARLVDEYAHRTGVAVENVDFYFVYGLFKLAGVLQQIYARFVRGHTHDERFAGMNRTVAILARQAARVVDRGIR